MELELRISGIWSTHHGDFQELGARLSLWLRELNFWRHDTSTPLHKRGVILYKSLTIGTVGSKLGRPTQRGANLYRFGF